jgi:hypothetical protein
MREGRRAERLFHHYTYQSEYTDGVCVNFTRGCVEITQDTVGCGGKRAFNLLNAAEFR